MDEKRNIEERLNNMQTPEIENSIHRKELRTNLMAAGSNRPDVEKRGIFERIESLVANGLYSRQPVWKTGIAVLILAGIIVPLSLFLPGTQPDTIYAKAANIVKTSFELQKMLNDSDNASIHNYTITVNGKDHDSIIVTFPTGAGSDDFPGGDIQISAYDPDTKSPVAIPADTPLDMQVSLDGRTWTISIVFSDQ